ncbi:helix-turn-helix domain-containing protein [Streptomyces sp. LP05-1]|uniref:DNA-3-methyladenine glycosylase II n=1 Tax=Streptomyces pyxinae TaxID=2970734 RepID=A0ABT2CMJ1_9ACTN|nr:AlkA N-terminal domain-containing protein [Streptomyces sp. LP05-1]MCS0637804.1 helix-turn-helix domain-containing protein [Streptomyces sp. LP05-1]
MNDDSRYAAVRSRDARFDGEFFFAVTTTGIYCRPSCPATTPKRANVRFFPTAAAAQGAGFRACRRCRPDAVPGSAGWNARADMVGRAMQLIGDGIVDREGVGGLAARLGYSARQVQRQLNAELGAGPIALARAQRSHTARILLQTTDMQAAEIAFAAGFASVRQFNDTIRATYAVTPGELRRARPAGSTRFGPVAPPDGSAGVARRLAYRGPYAAAEVFDHLERRALAGVEEVTGERGTRLYRRTLRLPYGSGIAEVQEAKGDGWLECRLHLSDLRDLTTASQRVRRLFDLDADPEAVLERLGRGDPDSPLARLVLRRPGMRSPGTVDAHELAVRAVLGQQVSVAAGRRLGGALVAAYGEPLEWPSGGLTHLFPRAAELAGAALEEIGMPAARRATVRTLCEALVDGAVVLEAGADRDAAEEALLRLRGVGPWTAGYIRMRGLSDPDVFLPSDVAALAGMRACGVAPAGHESWRPWRSYAMEYFWRATATTSTTAAPAADGTAGPDGAGGTDGTGLPAGARRPVRARVPRAVPVPVRTGSVPAPTGATGGPGTAGATASGGSAQAPGTLGTAPGTASGTATGGVGAAGPGRSARLAGSRESDVRNPPETGAAGRQSGAMGHSAPMTHTVPGRGTP